jgi:hypothetical protein
METAFFFRSNPASNYPSAGIINNTRLEAISNLDVTNALNTENTDMR